MGLCQGGVLSDGVLSGWGFAKVGFCPGFGGAEGMGLPDTYDSSHMVCDCVCSVLLGNNKISETRTGHQSCLTINGFDRWVHLAGLRIIRLTLVYNIK